MADDGPDDEIDEVDEVDEVDEGNELGDLDGGHAGGGPDVSRQGACPTTPMPW